MVEEKSEAKPAQPQEKKAVKVAKVVTKVKKVAAPKKAAKPDWPEGVRDIGIDVKPPKVECTDMYCPFHGSLSVRGAIIDGVVVSDKMAKTVVVKKERRHYNKKFERYELRTSKYSAHSPPCLGVKAGDAVKIMECRPLSKTVSFVVVERR